MTLWKWSQNPANNATADSTMNWAEGMAPSAVNDGSRAMMAAVAKYRDDNAGSIVTGGGSTSTAYVLTSNQGFDTLAHLHNQSIAFVPSVTSTNTISVIPPTPVAITLNVDSTGAKPIRLLPGVELPSATLIAGTPYLVTYNNTDGAFYLQNFGSNPYVVPVGALMPYAGTFAPNSAFALPFGQAISQSVYSKLYSIIGPNVYGTDSGGNFSLPDLRGRVPFGQDNMGGATAGRITPGAFSSGNSNIAGTVIGTTGGQQTIGLSSVNMPTILGTGQLATPGVLGSSTTTAAAASSGGLSLQTLTGGSSQPFPIMPPMMITTYILRVI